MRSIFYPARTGAVASAALLFLLSGCSQQGYSVIASTATTIGVGVTQQPANGTVDATLGYKRAEFALVPTNRSGGESAGDAHQGAADSADVVMELRYSGFFDTTDKSGIYQRLAIGKHAVATPGAALMFAKGADGSLTNTAAAIKAVQSIPAVSSSMLQQKAPYASKFLAASDADKQKYNAAAKSAGFQDFSQFAIDDKTTAEQFNKVVSALKASGIQP